MSIRMLIDASHQEETRVAIVDGNRVEDFDYESSAKKQLKGSIYLAKVTRVEPSLQAAFVDYGGNRHGFLAFSEIHPDYYQIPVADREALIAQEAAANIDLLEDDEKEKEKPKKKRRQPNRKKSEPEISSANADIIDKKDVLEPEELGSEKKLDKNKKSKTKAETTKSDEVIVHEPENIQDVANKRDLENSNEPRLNEIENSANKKSSDNSEPSPLEDDTSSSEEDEEERLRIKMAKRLRYKYKIQEVIKKNQIILIQVVKEERGNKGAALTTYLSLPGRYCVLMPNTLHGGGVSRKIANVADRKKLKTILSSLNMPKGHACIIRTAGSDRTKSEINRDYDYLKRMWEAIRDLTLKSIAPSQIYEEGNLIKRSLRDLYTRDVSEILVEGETGFKSAKKFMNMLLPSHAKKVVHYEDEIPLFQRYKVESHLDSMYSPTAQLKSGGYIVINPTEALVSIDVNSGRATKEQNIEETALKTNLEAAEEVARQLKLRDMAGLVVIDFIDMEDNRNNRAVERKMKNCLKSDRARIQVGRISSFGLMEMSRQRIRIGVLESSTTACPHCEGSGLLRTVESQSLHILRIIEEEGIKAKNSYFTVFLPAQVAVYILNNKRDNLTALERRYDFSVSIDIDESLTASAYRMEKSGKPSKTSQMRKDSLSLGREVNAASESNEEKPHSNVDNNDRPKRRRRRRRGQQGRQNNNPSDVAEKTAAVGEVTVAETQDRLDPNHSSEEQKTNKNKIVKSEVKSDVDQTSNAQIKNTALTKEKRKTRPRRSSKVKKSEVESEQAAKKEIKPPKVDKSMSKKPKRALKKNTPKIQPEAKVSEKEKGIKAAPPSSVEAKPKKKGWWSR
ncbi:MAG: ribonuclease E/G [Kordiimonadaceae bacterium]|nr:ribonuclease E/G [Kordiimonadaceae bacterium]